MFAVLEINWAGFELQSLSVQWLLVIPDIFKLHISNLMLENCNHLGEVISTEYLVV